MAFNATGDKIFAGFDRMIRFFDISQPSRDFKARPLSKTRRSRDGQRGIISTIHFNPDHSKYVLSYPVILFPCKLGKWLCKY